MTRNLVIVRGAKPFKGQILPDCDRRKQLGAEPRGIRGQILVPLGQSPSIGGFTARHFASAAYGHFGRPDFTWERLDPTAELLESANKV
jgi:hypothetical protein